MDLTPPSSAVTQSEFHSSFRSWKSIVMTLIEFRRWVQPFWHSTSVWQTDGQS